MIYDFYREYSFVIAVVLCLILIWFALIVCFTVRGILQIKNGKGKAVAELVLPAFLPLIIVAVITVAFASFGAKTVAFFRSEKQVASGQLEVLSVERNDYRDEELYDISFKVGSVELCDAVNSYSRAQMEAITKSTDVIVEYGYIGDELVIVGITEAKTHTGK